MTKRIIHLALLIAITSTLLVSRTSFGVLAIHDPVGPGYTGEANVVGQNPPTTGLTGPWQSTTTGIYRAASSGLGFHNGSQQLISTGGSIQQIIPNAANREVNRAIDSPPNGLAGEYYLSGIVSPPAPRDTGNAANDGFAMFRLQDLVSNLPAGTFNLQFGVNAREVRVRTRDNTDHTIASTYTPNDPLFFVLKVEENTEPDGFTDTISVWLNPGNLTSETLAGTPDAVILAPTTDQANGPRAYDDLSLRVVNFSNGTAAFDELRAGTTWQDVTPHRDVAVLPVVEDAHIHRASGGGDNNFGGDAEMEVKNSASSTFERKVYLKFDLSQVTNTLINDAVLSLTMDHDGGTLDSNQTNAWVFNVYGLNDGLDDMWSEGGITWNNSEDVGNVLTDGGAIDPNDATLLGQFTVAGSPAVQLFIGTDDLPGLADFLRASTDDLATLIITRQTTGDGGGDIPINVVHSIRSREFGDGGFAAELIVTTVPEPASVTLLLVGGAALMRRRRRA